VTEHVARRAEGRGPAPAEPISTRRLTLVPLRVESVRELLRGDLRAASQAQGLDLPEEFPVGPDDGFLRIQLARLEAGPSRRSWCVRAIVRSGDGQVVGFCGFHGPPEAVGRAEINYTVFSEHRGQGYAPEAAAALVSWAATQGWPSVFASIAPGNQASLAVARKLGLVQTGTQMDEIDGEELVFETPTPSHE